MLDNFAKVKIAVDVDADVLHLLGMLIGTIEEVRNTSDPSDKSLSVESKLQQIHNLSTDAIDMAAALSEDSLDDHITTDIS